MRTKHVRVRTEGFSLMELMVVVVITGILAATAIPTFTDYLNKSRTSEATSFLGLIKLKQEANRSEFGAYMQCSGRSALSDFGTPGNFVPAKGSAPRNLSIPWTATDAGAGIACFNALGASPDGPVRFRYAWIAGTPGPAFTGSGLATAAPLGLGITTPDHYFVAQGHCDLDDDGVWGVFELSNFTRNVWVGTTGGADLALGWE